MRDDIDNRRPEEIESDIARTRAEMGSTLDAIQNKLTPGQMMDQAIQYARHSLPADFGSNLANTVRNNPMPVALIGVGIAWMMMQGQQGGGYMRSRSRYPSEYYDPEALDYDAAYGTSDESGSKTQGARAKLGEAKDRASETGHRLMDKASEVTGRAHDAMHGARERITGSASAGRERMSELGQRSQQQYQRVRNSFSQMLEEQPLVLGALGVALGALAGAMMPPTRREDEMMGRTRDDLLAKAKEAGREQAQTLKESAQRVAETVKEEAQRVGSEVSTSTGAHARSDGQSMSGATETGRPGSLH
jgi:ElaB/YqjD/DUF883 family membrane-anchored ribosome-binding protein